MYLAILGGPDNAGSWSPLVAAAVGGLVGAMAAGGVRSWQDKKARDRERYGLLRIIDTEVAANHENLNGIFQVWKIYQEARTKGTMSADEAYGGLFRYLAQDFATNQLRLEQEDWKENKAKLTQLIPTDLLDSLVEHYKFTTLVTDLVKDKDRPPNEKVGRLQGNVTAAIAKAELARRKIEEYIRSLPTPN
jgi:hypothetical protein